MRSRRYKIFILDDEEEFLEEMREMLSLSGYEVCASSDNERAIDKLLQFRPNLLLIDLKMTPRSGFQIADEIKNSLHWDNLNIIAMSAYFFEKEHLALMNTCGIKSFLTKPFTPLNLISKIEFEINRSKETSLLKKNHLNSEVYVNASHVLEDWKAVGT